MSKPKSNAKIVRRLYNKLKKSRKSTFYKGIKKISRTYNSYKKRKN